MKLAEALSVRADLQRRISQLKSRLKDSSKIQEGDTPAEDVNDLYKELGDCLTQLEELTYRINHTNMQTVHEGETLTRIIARKDMLTLRISVMRDVLSHVIENTVTDGMKSNTYAPSTYLHSGKKWTHTPSHPGSWSLNFKV